MQWTYRMLLDNKNASMQQLLRGKIRGTSLRTADNTARGDTHTQQKCRTLINKKLDAMQLLLDGKIGFVS